MYIVTEKRKIVGMLKTLVGTYRLLDTEIIRHNGNYIAMILDDEGFENYAIFNGDFISMPSTVPVMIDVKRLATKEEQEKLSIEQLETVE